MDDSWKLHTFALDLALPSNTDINGASLISKKNSNELYLLIGANRESTTLDTRVLIWKFILTPEGVPRIDNVSPKVVPTEGTFRWGFGAYVNQRGEIEVLHAHRNMGILGRTPYWISNSARF